MKSERGQSFIELGISMIFLLVLLAGVMDLGRVIFTYIALRDAVQEGAAYSAIKPDDCDGSIARIREHTSGAVDLSAANIDVIININGYSCKTSIDDPLDPNPVPLDDICPGDQIEVTAKYNDFVIATPFIGAMVGGQSIDFDTKVFDSIVVDPTPSHGASCIP